MKITWYGQASFGIEHENVLIVTDPYDPDKSGFKPFPKNADIIIKSSSSDDFHDNDHLVPKKENYNVIDALVLAQTSKTTTSHGLIFKAIEAMENLDHDSHDPNQNAMYRFNVNDIEIGHMGDMGNNFSEEQMKFFEGIDILLSHAGGFPVISLEELNRIVNTVKPKLVIPMHFRTLCFKPQKMHFINSFIESFGNHRIEFACTSSIEINPSDLPNQTKAIVLDYL